jgi:hypothetical protein
VDVNKKYSKNNYLSKLVIDDYELTPKFDKDTLEYSVELEPGTEKININTTVKIITPTSNNAYKGRVSIVAGSKIEQKPKIKITLNIHDPIALPTAISFSPFLAATIDVTSSGKDVPTATIVKPITICGILNFIASALAPLIKKSAPLINKTKPIIKINILNNIINLSILLNYIIINFVTNPNNK